MQCTGMDSLFLLLWKSGKPCHIDSEGRVSVLLLSLKSMVIETVATCECVYTLPEWDWQRLPGRPPRPRLWIKVRSRTKDKKQKQQQTTKMYICVCVDFAWIGLTKDQGPCHTWIKVRSPFRKDQQCNSPENKTTQINIESSFFYKAIPSFLPSFVAEDIIHRVNTIPQHRKKGMRDLIIFISNFP